MCMSQYVPRLTGSDREQLLYRKVGESKDTYPFDVKVLKIGLIGHRKRILASLGDRLHEETPQKPPRAISLREPGGNHTPPQLSPSVGQAAYTAGVPGGSLDVQHLIMQADARRRQRSNDNYFEDVPRSKLERQMAQVSMVRKGGQDEWRQAVGESIMNGHKNKTRKNWSTSFGP
ncbi:hypothetical protein FQN60_005773 [Etheostoma spectabile]|uniref:Uncharacterized protein n=1 Tax=Etheostoma spectabile TaxID=54343 RepID=A0A5J5CF67_9PERO|nr:hypothetical protein FQN60_005773 [Etheostoma spectabile]